eukprot:jgi/Bigna1/87851/estExt_fgenesh1_pg.C_250026
MSKVDDKKEEHAEQRRQLELLTKYPENGADLTSLKSLDLRFQELAELPESISKCVNLWKLDVGSNKLKTLPKTLAHLEKLKILFATGNEMEEIPAVLKDMKGLTMLSLMRNRIKGVVDCAGFPAMTQWLIMTDNKITEIKNIGLLKKLQKCMFSHNCLTDLPPDIKAAAAHTLTLSYTHARSHLCRLTRHKCDITSGMRISSNLDVFPKALFNAPHISWIALSGNGCTKKAVEKMITDGTAEKEEIDYKSLNFGEDLGEGSGGKVRVATLVKDSKDSSKNIKVAVKEYRGAHFSDGTAADEWKLNKVLPPHSHILSSIGTFKTPHLGLVLELLEGAKAVGGPPSLDSCTRDTQAKGEGLMNIQFALKVAMAVCDAARHLHKHNIAHGDIYLHNTLKDSKGSIRLSDFGAAFVYPKELQPQMQGIEVRSFGWLLDDLVRFSEVFPAKGEVTAETQCSHQSLRSLAKQCTQGGDPAVLPTFDDLAKSLTVVALTVVGKAVRRAE